MNGRAEVVRGSQRIIRDLEPGSGPASKLRPCRSETRYPRQTEMVLGALPSAVPCARRHVTAVLRYEWGLPAVVETVEHVVSELVTNAVQASEGLVNDDYPFPPTIQMWLSTDQDWVIVQVWDANNQLPEKREPDLETEGGRGLFLVDAMSESCGVYRLEGDNGKIVWARLAAGH